MAGDYYDVLNSSDQIKDNYEKYKDKYVQGDKDTINTETFLKLLVAEMSNQDPLEPTSNTEFISQLAQFSSMQYMQDASKYAQANYASSLVGKTATAYKVEGKEVVFVTDVVEKVTKGKDGSYTVTIKGEEFPLDRITSVSEAVKKEEPSEDEENKTDPVIDTVELGDRIARASAMIETYATVGVGTIDDKGAYKEIKQGFIEAIQVSGGKINVIIEGTTYPIENILEVTHAYIVDDPENPDDPGEGEETEGVDGVTDTDESASGSNSGTNNGDIPDIEDLPDDEEEALAQLRSLIESMS